MRTEDTMRVLIVEDNRDCADTQAMLLRAWGHEARVAYDGPSPAEMAHEQPPDVMFIDIKMPGMDGCKLARIIKADSVCCHARLFAITGLSSHDLQRNAAEIGFEDYLLKPVDPNVLRSIVENANERSAY